MDKSEFMPMIWILPMMLWMTLSRSFNLPPPFDSIVSLFGFIILIGGIFMQDIIAQRKKPTRFITTLFLGEINKHHIYGKVNMAFIRHNLEIRDRIKLRKAQGMSMGMLVDHPQTDYPYLYEYPVPHIDHAKKYPIYELIVGSGDYPIMALLIKKYLTEENIQAILAEEGLK